MLALLNTLIFFARKILENPPNKLRTLSMFNNKAFRI